MSRLLFLLSLLLLLLSSSEAAINWKWKHHKHSKALKKGGKRLFNLFGKKAGASSSGTGKSGTGSSGASKDDNGGTSVNKSGGGSSGSSGSSEDRGTGNGKNAESGGSSDGTHHGRVGNDPHFVGAHGTRFDFNGLPGRSFCLFTDANVHINMLTDGYYDDNTAGASVVSEGKALRTWIRQLNVMFRAGDQTHNVLFVARRGKSDQRDGGFLGHAEFDGSVLSVPSEAGQTMELQGGAKLTFVGPTSEGPFEADAYRLSIGGVMALDVLLRPADPRLRTADDAQVHINVQFTEVMPSPLVHGVLGQTYRPSRVQRSLDFSALGALLRRPVAADTSTGSGLLDGEILDYATSDITAADCKFTAFGGKTLS